MAKPKTMRDSAKEAKPATFVTVERLVADAGVTLEPLEQTTARTLGLLQAVAANEAIRRKLAGVGLNAKEQRRAVDLLSLVCVIPDTDARQVENDAVRESMNFVDDNDDEVHRVLRSIDPDGAGGAAPFSVFCDMNEDGGGRTLVISSRPESTFMSGESASWKTADGVATTDMQAEHKSLAFDTVHDWSRIRITNAQGDKKAIWRFTGAPLPCTLLSFFHMSTSLVGAVGSERSRGVGLHPKHACENPVINRSWNTG